MEKKKLQFIRYLLGRDFPGQRIGPEPTTDRFVAVMNGPDERVVPGNALTVSPNLPYRGLDRFGVAFLNKFEASQLPSPVLRNITIVDTPGEIFPRNFLNAQRSSLAVTIVVDGS